MLQLKGEQLRRCIKEQEVVVADFWAEWCVPCRLVSPVVERIAERYSGRASFVRVNVNEDLDLAAEHFVVSLPTVIVFQHGEEVMRLVGATPNLENKLEEAIHSLSHVSG